MRKRCEFVFAISLGLFSLTGCGGGGSGGDVSGSDGQVVSDITGSNINSWGSGTSGTNRWVGTGTNAPQIAVFIPTPTNVTETDLAAKTRGAIAAHNHKLAGSAVLTEVSTAPASGGYFRVSYLTSYVPPGSTDYSSYCANVSTAAGAPNVVNPASPNGSRNQAVAWINLGNGHCDVTQDIVTHEFGHGLGLGNHFHGFGDPEPISTEFWDVLATLYANPVRTPAAQLAVHRAPA